jgi:N-hydroxyarylamine O-acetyltransferase
MDSTGEAGFALDAYLARIGYAGERAPNAAVLDAVHLAHATTVPFENLDIQLGLPVRLDLASLQAKLVRDRRGGYCFEQNTLLAAALGALGFKVTTLLARVRISDGRVTARSHMVLRVAAGGDYLADVGFGGTGLLRPVPLEAGPAWQQFGWRYRLAREDEQWVLQAHQQGAWQDQYAFTTEPQFAADFEVANWYTSTHPQSHFVRTLTAQRVTPGTRYVLRNRELELIAPDQTTTRTLAGEGDVLRVLGETFGLHFPPGTRFRSLQQAVCPSEPGA